VFLVIRLSRVLIGHIFGSQRERPVGPQFPAQILPRISSLEYPLLSVELHLQFNDIQSMAANSPTKAGHRLLSV
jgi:hypothetical protein